MALHTEGVWSFNTCDKYTHYEEISPSCKERNTDSHVNFLALKC